MRSGVERESGERRVLPSRGVCTKIILHGNFTHSHVRFLNWSAAVTVRGDAFSDGARESDGRVCSPISQRGDAEEHPQAAMNHMKATPIDPLVKRNKLEEPPRRRYLLSTGIHELPLQPQMTSGIKECGLCGIAEQFAAFFLCDKVDRFFHKFN